MTSLIAACIVLLPQAAAREIDWRKDYAAAVAESKKTGRNLHVYFTAAT